MFAVPGASLPGAAQLGLGGAAHAQGYVDIDYFYDELDPYGQWVWHPRFGYVWLPVTVSPYWRPYTVGRWVYTGEYGWYWDSYEPFAWAVYHYGRWGYDPDYGWFWVPGDVWAPAWVQWRYSDAYVGWAPIGPGRRGYAYGAPVSYEPPIAEAWVFVQPRYMTSRAIAHFALPIGALGPAFFSATTVYRPEFRRGVVYNYGIPRDRVVKIIKRPIVVEKVYRFDRKDRWERGAHGNGVKIYAPGFAKSDRPHRGPKRFADHPNQFRPKAKLKETYKGDVPKGWGPSAKAVVPITKEAGPDAWKKKHGDFGREEGIGRPFEKDKDRDKTKGQAAKEPFMPGGPGEPSQAKGFDQDQDNWKRKNKQQFGAPGGPDQGFDQDQDNWKRKNKQQFGTPGGPVEPSQAERFDQDDQGDRKRNKNKQQFGAPGAPDQGFDQDQDNWKRKNKQQFGAPGGPGGPGGPGMQQGGERAQGGDQGAGQDGGKGDNNKKKQAKCEKHPDHPGCQ
jgi:hypothetical protein